MKIFKTVKASKRLPDDPKDVVLILQSGELMIGCYEGDGWYTDEFGSRTNFVKYWLEEIK